MATGLKRLIVTVSLLSWVLIACEGKKASDNNSSPTAGSDNVLGGTCNNDDRRSIAYTAISPRAYCGTAKSISNAVTITGKATYTPYVIDTSSSAPLNQGLTDNGSPMPIRYAEVQVLDENGEQLQCGETDSNGNFSLRVPSSSSTYSVNVNSRAENSHYKAHIYNCPEAMGIYSLKENFVPNSNKDLGTINASPDGDALAGAFNILDQILNANLFLRSKVSNCSFAGCQDFTVAPTAHIFWDVGFNPNAYAGSPNEGLSFFSPSTNRLFILGGIDGDVANSDTDHFDNSVILHEYAHFLESNLFKSDSPGGSHRLDSLLDPRLAWSEGFANFFQAAVTGYPKYVDTYGSPNGAAAVYFKIDVENQNGPDKPVDSGEGNFREFAVTRALWDIHDDTTHATDGTESVSDGFSEIWATVTSTLPGGFLGSSSSFRSIGLLYDYQKNISGAQNWATPISTNKQLPNRTEYAYYVTTGLMCSGMFSITPTSDSNHDSQSDDGQSMATSHLLKNNDFFHYRHPGGSLNITLNYTTSSGVEADLDLIVYRYDGQNYHAILGNSDDIVNDTNSFEGQDEPDTNIASSESESVSASVPAGDYLLNIHVYTGARDHDANAGTPDIQSPGGPTTYTLRVGGQLLCPTTLP